MLSPDQLAQYDRDGFLVLPDFVSAAACAELRARAVEIVDAWEPGTARTAFTTIRDERPRNEEFLSSGGITWCFFEEEAFGADGELRQAVPLTTEFERFIKLRKIQKGLYPGCGIFRH